MGNSITRVLQDPARHRPGVSLPTPPYLGQSHIHLWMAAQSAVFDMRALSSSVWLLGNPEEGC